ncbi:MAG TPA: PEP-CTERM sorting domain-containing protein [Bryobacteraceae bacterium]|nr:PEP-CTERM sorting domain-containing protein [Bryobacteraceae bacterium]
MFLTICSAAQASLIVFTDRTTFLNAVGPNSSTIDFEGIAPAGGAYDTCGTLVLDGVQFVGTSGDGRVRCGTTFVNSASLAPAGRYDWGTGDSLMGDRFGFFQSSGTPIGNLRAILPANTYAVGTDYTIVHEDDGNRAGNVLFDVWIGGIDNQFTLSADTTTAAAFEGFISTDPIDSIQYRVLGVGSSAPQGGFDNFTTSAATPEPNTLILLGMTAGLFGGIRKRRLNAYRRLPRKYDASGVS